MERGQSETNKFSSNSFGQSILKPEKWRGEGFIAEILVDVSGQKSAVPIVSHVTTVVDASDEVFQGVPWCFLIFIQIDRQQVFGHLKIRIVEAVNDVPAQLLEFLSFQKDRMEIAQTEQQLFVLLPILASVELLLCDYLIQTFQVGFQTLENAELYLNVEREERQGLLEAPWSF